MALNRPLLGGKLKIALLTDRDAPAILYQRVGRFDFYLDSVKPYFYYFLQSPFFIRDLKELLQGSDQPFMNKPKLLNILIPLPPIAEQCRIISTIERIKLSVDSLFRLEREIDEEISALVRSVIDKVYRSDSHFIPQQSTQTILTS